MVSSASEAIIKPNITLESCAQLYDVDNHPDNGTNAVFCSWTWDSIACWPPTLAGKTAYQKCPLMHGFDPTKFAERRCSESGQWASMLNAASALGDWTDIGTNTTTTATTMMTTSKTTTTLPLSIASSLIADESIVYNGSVSGGGLTVGAAGRGWTNYTPCFTPELHDLMRRLNETGNAETILDIAARTRVLEYVGLSVSLVALLVSLGIFFRFRSLRNNRTRIHKNLFVAMCIQVIIRLTMYIDQAIIRRHDAATNHLPGIDNTPGLCEAAYALLEYARTAMFMWMFIEGLYLHNVVTLAVFHGQFPYLLYALLGWGGPLLLTAVWTAVMAYQRYGHKCWWGYNFTPYYWILEGPRLAVIVLNVGFLLNIVRVLVVKLRQSRTSDVEQVRKAVRAAAVLLPLLGITNLLNMVEAPLDRSVWKFALWSYGTHFLTSFQGVCISMIYCFLNGEVRAVLVQNLSVYMTLRGYGRQWDPRRPSVFSAAAYVTAAETEAPPPAAATTAFVLTTTTTQTTTQQRRGRGTKSSSKVSGCLALLRRFLRRYRAKKESPPASAELAPNKMPLVPKTVVILESPIDDICDGHHHDDGIDGVQPPSSAVRVTAIDDDDGDQQLRHSINTGESLLPESVGHM